jgi:hypothetical protein
VRQLERKDDDILDPKALAAVFGVNQRTLKQMVREGRAPRPIGGLKPPFRWRWGAVRKWHEAMETLYGVGCVGGKIGHERTKTDENVQNSASDSEGRGGPRKPR